MDRFREVKKSKIIKGKVIESRLIKCDDKYDVYKPIVRYQYEIDGKIYISQTLCQENIYGTKEEMSDFIKKYPVGKQININIDPENPENPKVDLGITFQNVNFLIFIGSTLILLLMLFYELVKNQ